MFIVFEKLINGLTCSILGVKGVITPLRSVKELKDITFYIFA